MIIGTIVTPNQKGQIVIPQKIRVDLGIKPQKPLNLVAKDRIIYIYPISEVISSIEHETSYLDTLKATQGTWKNDTWSKTQTNRQKTELKASQKRKQPW